MTTKGKIACVVAVAKILIQIPLSFALTFLILRHIQATDVMWLLFWIGVPLSFTFSLVMETANIFLKEE